MNCTLSEFTGGRLFAAVLSACLLVACDKAPEPETKEIVRPVKLITLSSGGVGATLEYPGEISATQSVELGFEVAGKIVGLPISDGLEVKNGDLLGQLDPTDYLAARDAAIADRTVAQSAYKRSKRIFDQGAGSQAEVERALRDLDVAKEKLKKAQKALDDTALKAPFSGLVARKIAENFQNVQAKEAILLLQDISSLELDINVPEQDFVRMTTGLTLEQRTQRAKPEIAVSSLPNVTFPAWLISFETSADPVTRTYKATLGFDNPEDVNMSPGMTARVILHLNPDTMEGIGSGGFLIPVAAAVVDSAGSAYVWRYDPDSSQVSRAPVSLGEMTGAKVQVLDGLQSGDHIAISGAAHLQEGMKVRPLTDNKGKR